MLHPTCRAAVGREQIRLFPLLLLVIAVQIAAPSDLLARVVTFPPFDPDSRGPLVPELANGTLTAKPSLEALYLDTLEIRIDGRLDESAWELAHLATGVRQADPNRYADASVPTTFKVAYDDKALYFGVACFEDDIANIASVLSRRDRIEASDIVSIYIDPYNDKTTGYNFRITPDGVLQDDYIFNNGNRDRDWNAVWEAETWHDESGWYLEVRIPFSAIKFKPGEDMTWGMQVYRWLHGRGEDTGWVIWDRELSGFVNRWGTLTGLRGVENPRQLEALPYIALSAADPAPDEGEVDEWQTRGNVGADLKYGITSDLTLNATFQPDFGQVEADPALLNLSPYEAFYQEKRPFFIEGSRFFQHPNVNLFYSRRIGTGDPNSRIRGAAKLTGKIGGDLTVAALAAATDIAPNGRAHNPFAGGDHKAYYGVVRVGKEFNEGNHRFYVMQTGVWRDESPTFESFEYRRDRNAYTTGVDFDMNFKDRYYNIQGGVVGTVVDFKQLSDSPEESLPTLYGTGGAFNARKRGGSWRYGLNGRWETDKLDPNDVGFATQNDWTRGYAWGEYQWDADDRDSAFNNFFINVEGFRTWLYAPGRRNAADTSDPLWEYSAGHHRTTQVSVFAHAQSSHYWNYNFYAAHSLDGTSKYLTRFAGDERGPLMTVPADSRVELEVETDWRKKWNVGLEGEVAWSRVGTREYEVEASVRWNMTSYLTHRISVSYYKGKRDAQWLDNYETPGAGIGDVSYTYAQIDQQTWDLTLRSNLLFNRDNSLELYLQPFLTVGDYTRPRYLATPDSYDLQSYDIDASQFDFEFGAVNLNLVYRWEYRPGSTIFVVWAHSRDDYREKGLDTSKPRFDNGFNPHFLFRNEPENTFTVKFSYWFPI